MRDREIRVAIRLQTERSRLTAGGPGARGRPPDEHLLTPEPEPRRSPVVLGSGKRIGDAGWSFPITHTTEPRSFPPLNHVLGSGNQIGDDGWSDLAPALASVSEMETLRLRRPDLHT